MVSKPFSVEPKIPKRCLRTGAEGWVQGGRGEGEHRDGAVGVHFCFNQFYIVEFYRRSHFGRKVLLRGGSSFPKTMCVGAAQSRARVPSSHPPWLCTTPPSQGMAATPGPLPDSVDLQSKSGEPQQDGPPIAQFSQPGLWLRASFSIAACHLARPQWLNWTGASTSQACLSQGNADQGSVHWLHSSSSFQKRKASCPPLPESLLHETTGLRLARWFCPHGVGARE